MAEIGVHLKAPRQGRGGTQHWGYALVEEVGAGDIVVHYDSRTMAIQGASVVLGPAEPQPTFWVARGTSGRKAGAQPSWIPGLAAPLGQHRRLANPITRSDIEYQCDALLGGTADHPGSVAGRLHPASRDRVAGTHDLDERGQRPSRGSHRARADRPRELTLELRVGRAGR